VKWLKQQLDRNDSWLGPVLISLAAVLLGPRLHKISVGLEFIGVVTIVALAYSWWQRKGPFFHSSKSRHEESGRVTK
jgi:hypothetical protein